MSQMKPYCFKCGAELEPEAIYCPECGRLQRSMVVRTAPPASSGAPPAPSPRPAPGQPYEFSPGREAPPAGPGPDPSTYSPDAAPHQPDQPAPYGEPHQSEQGWHAGEQAAA